MWGMFDKKDDMANFVRQSLENILLKAIYDQNIKRIENSLKNIKDSYPTVLSLKNKTTWLRDQLKKLKFHSPTEVMSIFHYGLREEKLADYFNKILTPEKSSLFSFLENRESERDLALEKDAIEDLLTIKDSKGNTVKSLLESHVDKNAIDHTLSRRAMAQ